MSNGITNISNEIIKEACKIGEKEAYKYITLHINPKLISSFDISVIYENNQFTIEIYINTIINIDLEKLLDEAIDAALNAIDNFIRGKITCQNY
ncbi:MAG: hypothetical protein DSO09_01205 [Candidatus Methanomethylicota archaeon]|jgi:hypothetical protein|uniref:DUF3194 domain-containing protein n=1 Tax=Thermoproteota archaeon TaxID=2056631 RepID=A0A523BGP0_9CREN|nr:DUF3194 domain-containing protein [Candidatus Methanomethylicia archaeon]NHV45674.1 DUF3194 domain-containing protein [Candidatus Verstraetearchaeota archaeon]RZN56853.1 MAG: DUF3194 domain-containing protein [Candidatus Verstraetearchaeota archaeon]TDA40101.1 MAG: hypothetical protein DSO09_01205 [Candidatus Verstraetearchaeota archaeon]